MINEHGSLPSALAGSTTTKGAPWVVMSSSSMGGSCAQYTREAVAPVGELLGRVQGQKRSGSLVFSLQNKPTTTAAGLHLNDHLLVILFDVQRLQIAVEPSDEHLDALAQRLGSLREFFQIGQPPGFHPCGHGFFEHLVAKPAADKS